MQILLFYWETDMRRAIATASLSGTLTDKLEAGPLETDFLIDADTGTSGGHRIAEHRSPRASASFRSDG
jgi:hypothetical protein